MTKRVKTKRVTRTVNRKSKRLTKKGHVLGLHTGSNFAHHTGKSGNKTKLRTMSSRHTVRGKKYTFKSSKKLSGKGSRKIRYSAIRRSH
jgi:hypothetical protein